MPIHERLCDTIRNQIDDLTRSELRDMRLPTPVTEHARECSACKAHLDQVLALAEHLEGWPIPEPSKNIETGVMTRIAQLERDRRFNLADATYLIPLALIILAMRGLVRL